MATAFQLTDARVHKVSQAGAKGASLSAAVPAIGATLAAGAAEIAKAADEPRYGLTDDEVIAWLKGKNVVGPFTLEVLDQMRESMAGEEWAAKVQEIRRDPAQFSKLVAAYREEGLEQLANELEALGSIEPSSDPESEYDVSVALLPELPSGMSPEMRTIADHYVTHFLTEGETDEEADDNADRWAGAAKEVAAFKPLNQADMVAKLIISLHNVYPANLNQKLALRLSGFDARVSGEGLLSVANDLAATLDAPSNDTSAWGASLYRAKSLRARMDASKADTPGAFDDLVGELMKAEEALLRLAPPTLPAMAEKMRIIRSSYAGSVIPQTLLEDMEADVQRLAANA